MARSVMAAIALLALSTTLFAQDNSTNRDPSRQPAQPPQQSGQASGLDEQVAACLALANSKELALADFAQSRASDQRVQQFAAMMITDHEKALAKVKDFTPRYAEISSSIRTSRGELRDRDQTQASDRSATSQDNRSGNQPGQVSDRARQSGEGANTGEAWFAIEKAAAEKCLDMVMQEFEQKSGAEFDKAYMGSMVGAHIHMIAKLEAVQPHVSERMRPAIDECLAGVKRHFEEAKQLCMSLEKGNAAAQQPNR